MSPILKNFEFFIQIILISIIANFLIKTAHGTEMTNDCRSMDGQLFCQFGTDIYRNQLCIDNIMSNQTGKWFFSYDLLQWWISDLIHKKSEKFEFRKNILSCFLALKIDSGKRNFNIFCPRNFRKIAKTNS